MNYKVLPINHHLDSSYNDTHSNITQSRISFLPLKSLSKIINCYYEHIRTDTRSYLLFDD